MPTCSAPVDEHAQQAARLWDLLEQVSDPEIPVISLIDLGLVLDTHQAEAA